MASEEVTMTDAQIENGSDKVIFPELSSIKVKFLGHEIKMKPLPVKYARRLGTLIRPLMKKVAETSQKSTKSHSKRSKKPVSSEVSFEDSPLDDDAIDNLIDTAVILMEFYKLSDKISKDFIEDNASVTSLYQFAFTQVELNSKNDFLLLPLRMLLELVKAGANMAEVMARQNQEDLALISPS